MTARSTITDGTQRPQKVAMAIARFKPVDVLAPTCIVAGLTQILFSVGPQNDFSAFYASAKFWATGHLSTAALVPDLNPPTFGLLLAPLGWLSRPVARLVWTAFSVAAMTSVVATVRRELRLSARATLWLVVSCVALEPSVFAWALGQLTWMLAWLITRAWCSRTPRQASCWLGCAVALKPPLALMVMLLPLAASLPTAAVAGGITGSVMMLTGWRPWLQWVQLGSQIDWLPWASNTSLWATAARLIRPDHVTMADFSIVTIVAVGVLAALLAVPVVRADGSRRWVLAGLFSVAASPLGWTYYLPVLIGPMAAVRPRSRVLLGLALALFVVPMRQVSAWPLTGCVYTLATAVLWVALGASPTWAAARLPADRVSLGIAYLQKHCAVTVV